MHVARAKNSVSAADCRVETTVLGYYPNLGSGYFFTIMFGLCLIGTVVQGVRFKTWSYMGALTCGLILETAGAFFCLFAFLMVLALFLLLLYYRPE